MGNALIITIGVVLKEKSYKMTLDSTGVSFFWFVLEPVVFTGVQERLAE